MPSGIFAAEQASKLFSELRAKVNSIVETGQYLKGDMQV